MPDLDADMQKRISKERLMKVDGFDVLACNNYGLLEVCIPARGPQHVWNAMQCLLGGAHQLAPDGTFNTSMHEIA